MGYTFTIDGVQRSGIGIYNIRRTATIKDDNNTGWLINGGIKRSILGTYYDFTFTLVCREGHEDAYDYVYQVLTSPANEGKHTIRLPFGYHDTIDLVCYVESVTDSAVIDDTGYKWSQMEVQCFAAAPNREAT